MLKKLKVLETRYTDGIKKDEERITKISSKDFVTEDGRVVGFNYNLQYANCVIEKFVSLADLSYDEPFLIDSYTYRFDELGDHDMWTTDTYLQLVDGSIKPYKVLFSPTGGTEKVLNILGAEFEATETIDLSRDEDFGLYEFDEDDLCLFGIPSFAGRVPAVAAERWSHLKGNNAKAILVCVYGNRAYDDTLLEMKNIALEAGFKPIAAIAANAEHSIVREYGAARPDSDDEADLKQFAKTIKNLIAENSYKSDMEVPGNIPYKDVGKNSLVPIAGDGCIDCGLCAEKCPVGAISEDEPAVTDGEKCIGCMRCLAICPVENRGLNEQVFNTLKEKLREHCRERKANELFL